MRTWKERMVLNARSLGQEFLRSAVLAALICLGACTTESSGPNSPNNPEEPAGSPPAMPSFMQLVPTAEEPNRGMFLYVHDASNDEDGFRIERKTVGGGFSSLTSLPPNTERYDDWGLEISVQYTYRIQAYNEFGSSSWSEKTQIAAGPEPGTILLYPVADAYVSNGSPNSNSGMTDHLKVVKYDDGGIEEAYLRFPYDQIPSHVVEINDVELRLVSFNTLGFLTAAIYAEDLAFNWNENTVTWNNRPFGRGVAADNAYVFNDGQPVYWNITTYSQRLVSRNNTQSRN